MYLAIRYTCMWCIQTCFKICLTMFVQSSVSRPGAEWVATYVIHTAPEPEPDECVLSITEGFVILNTYTITCSGIEDPNGPVMYTVEAFNQQTDEGTMVMFIRLYWSKDTWSSGRPVYIKERIDYIYLYMQCCFEVWVYSPFLKDSSPVFNSMWELPPPPPPPPPP